MSIRIRVYPQSNSIGARRNRAIRRQQHIARQNFNWQQQLLRQQMQQSAYGLGGYGGYGASGYGSIGTGSSAWATPNVSGWGFANSGYPGGYGSVGSAYAGAYTVPGYGYGGSFSNSYSNGYSTGYGPVNVAQYAGYGRGWNHW